VFAIIVLVYMLAGARYPSSRRSRSLPPALVDWVRKNWRALLDESVPNVFTVVGLLAVENSPL
jgi:hypothetical protein